MKILPRQRQIKRRRLLKTAGINIFFGSKQGIQRFFNLQTGSLAPFPSQNRNGQKPGNAFQKLHYQTSNKKCY